MIAAYMAFRWSFLSEMFGFDITIKALIVRLIVVYALGLALYEVIAVIRAVVLYYRASNSAARYRNALRHLKIIGEQDD